MPEKEAYKRLGGQQDPQCTEEINTLFSVHCDMTSLEGLLLFAAVSLYS